VVHERGRELIDATAADAQWSANTARPRITEKAAPAQEKSESLTAARLRRERAEASLCELRQQELEGKLCRVEEVQRAAAHIGRLTRDSLLGIPSRIAADLANAPGARAVEELLTAELRKVLADIAKTTMQDLSRVLPPQADEPAG
jgi:phage terminase Nu1 subunit (DNA packaging protein)